MPQYWQRLWSRAKMLRRLSLASRRGHAVVFEQADDPRYGELQADGSNPFVVGVGAVAGGAGGPLTADLLPVGEAVAAVTAVVDLDDFGQVAG